MVSQDQRKRDGECFVMKKIIALLFLCSGWAHAWTYVQSTTTTFSGCTGVSNSITVTAGDMLTAGCWLGAAYNSFSGTTLTDSAGDNFVLNVSTYPPVGGTQYPFGIFSSTGAVGGATTFTFSPQGCNAVGFCLIEERSGQTNTNMFDVASGSAPIANGTLATTLSTTTSNTNELMVSYLYDGQVSTTSATGTARAYLSNSTYGVYIFSQDAVVPTASVYISTWNLNSSINWEALQASYNPVAGGGGSTTGTHTYY